MNDQLNNNNMKHIDVIKSYSFACHDNTNQTYGGDKPYSFHLQMVADIGMKNIELIPVQHRDVVIAACYCHDLIEDARQTYNDVKEATGSVDVAEIVRACTNYTRGRNRKERMPDWLYSEIRNNSNALFVKLCDRIANAAHSKYTGSSMLNVYIKEQPHFKTMLYNGLYQNMWIELDNILTVKN